MGEGGGGGGGGRWALMEFLVFWGWSGKGQWHGIVYRKEESSGWGWLDSVWFILTGG